MLFFYSTALTVFALVASSTSAFQESNLVVQTAQGTVKGFINPAGIREWKGIPYGQPPVGENRWEESKAIESLTDDGSTYSATFDAPGCPQHCNLPPGNCPAYGTSEDCLYLSVYSPTEASSDPEGYPVLFWIHGGAFEQGLGNCALYNGSTFAQHDVVVVTINYRLGALGFMASPSMEGNYGFLDQRLAMKWVQQNIRAFGGDPNRVTAAGQSAGAMSVGSHLISPNSKGLFQKSIMESNPLALPYHTRSSAAANAAVVFEYLGCAEDDVACMRTKSVDEILDAQDNAIKLDLDSLLLNFLPFAPMVEPDGEIPEQPLDGLREGLMQIDSSETSMPMLHGSMYDEGQLFIYELFTKPVGEHEYNLIVEGVFGLKSSKKILELYPYDLTNEQRQRGKSSKDGLRGAAKKTADGEVDARDALNVLATDLIFYCPLRNVSQGYQAVTPSYPASFATYIYRFKHVLSFDAWGPDYSFCVGYVCHGSELPFVFNVFTDGTPDVDYDPTPEEQQLARDLGNAWANFVTYGNPNKGPNPIVSPPGYPLYQTSTDSLVVLDEPDTFEADHVRDQYCDLWDTLGYFY